ncbi:MAG TPA: MTH1187 family thiamine-binding protein [Elusimicrobiota bacterium]|nr:MTH1187 family thiamine-binding protein [Elusimicrobiota bacterium]
MSLLLEFSLTPLGKGESVGKHVARVLDIVDKSGVPYRVHSMGTVLEGDWETVFGVVKKCFRRMQKDCPRVILTLKADGRKGRAGRIAGKVAGLEKRLGRRLTKD